MNISEAVMSRRSIRAFLDKPVALETLEHVLDKARWAPSGCNFQPWQATVLTGEPLRRLQEKLVAAQPQDPIEYSFSEPNQSPLYRARLHDLGSRLYGAMNIQRDDKKARDEFSRSNTLSFGAPVLLLCYFERFMGPPQWSDVGMWLQTIMLLLREEGLDSCPQEALSFYSRLIKEEIGISDETHIFFCGLAIGYRDPEKAANNFERSRADLSDSIKFHGF